VEGVFICAECGGTAYPHAVDIEKFTDSKTVLIRDIPCLKCGECDEVYYSETVLRMVENTLKDLFEEATALSFEYNGDYGASEDSAYYRIIDYEDIESYQNGGLVLTDLLKEEE
jgi:YgiT-type zinc finger domain-containing protein